MDHKVSKDMISSGMIPSGEKTQADLGRTQYGSAPSPSSLMDAYKSIYEHHQKDADGKVIEHEEEEVNEGKMPEGLKNYLMKKKGKKEDKKEMKEENIDEMNAGYSTDAGLASTPKPQVSTMTRQGKPRSKAQMMAAKRISSGKTIADVKASNVQSMRSRAAERNAAFKAKRAGVSKPMSDTQGKNMPSNPQLKSQPKTSTSSNMSGSNRRAMMSKRRRGLMNDVDLFDLIKGRLIDEFYLEEKEALNLMINLSEAEINEILGGVKGDGYIGHPRLGIKNPLNPPKKETKKTNGGKGLTNKLGNRATEIERMLNQ